MSVEANAHPEKRLFISLLTRDISLADAFLDLLDNSINAAMKSFMPSGSKSADYLVLLEKPPKKRFKISLNFTPSKVVVEDNCGGISADDAVEDVFVFGAGDQEGHEDDTLSVYGIGMKRAMFKLGKNIEMTSEHAKGGFTLSLDVEAWAASDEQPWKFEISPRQPSEKGTTRLQVTDLYKAVRGRLEDGQFETQLRDRIARAYAFFISKIVDIDVNGVPVLSEQVTISDNNASETFVEEDVNVTILAGLGIPKDKRYTSDTAGWNVYCNGRSVISFDKSPLTGWGVDGYMPTFQPKHRPFVGIVFFSSDHPESLPWTTTKLGVNPDNVVWQKTLQRMADTAKPIIKFLDGRYSEEGTSISSDELQDAIGTSKPVSLRVTSDTAVFKPPKKQPSNLANISYKVDKKQLESAKAATGQRSISNSDFGRYTYDYFIDNEVE